MEPARKTPSPQPSGPMHDEVVTRANESTTSLMSAKSATEPASNPLSAYSITDSRQKTTPPPETVETAESMEMALKILNSPPVLPTLSGGMERYGNNISDIQQALESAIKAKSADERAKNWKKCGITAKVLLAVLNEKKGKADCSAARNALKQWVQYCILLKKTNQSDLKAYPASPAKTRDEFITWCLAVARAASIGTPTIAQDASLEYLCYIRALNAGCAEARLFIIRDHLLGELYRKPPSYKRFLPREAEAQLKLIAAARNDRLPKPEGLDETHYKIIYDLVDLIRSDSKDKESKRDVLAERWIACKEYEIQQLTSMLYLQDAYGNFDATKVNTYLVTISQTRYQDLKEFSSFELVHQYWCAEYRIGNPSMHSSCIIHMEKLAEDVHPAALYRVIEYGQARNIDITCSFLMSLKKSHLLGIKKRIRKNSIDYNFDMLKYMELKTTSNNHWYFPMMMAPSFNAPLAYIFYIFWERYSVKKQTLNEIVIDFLHATLRDAETKSINQSTIDKVNVILSITYSAHLENIRAEAASRLQSNLTSIDCSVSKLRLSLQNLEDKFPFVEDAQILVFRHFTDFISQGKADKTLLDDAMAQNPVATCYRLLSLNHCNEIWGYNKLIEKILEHSKVSIDFLYRWRSDAGFIIFVQQMTGTYTLKYPSTYCQLMYSISKFISGKKLLTGIYTRIAARKLMQGHMSDAKSMYKKARELGAKDINILSDKIFNRERLLRTSMPKYYLDIYETGLFCTHSCNLRHDLNTLIRIGEHLLKNNNDPAAHLAWCCRVTPFMLNKYISYPCNIHHTSPIIDIYELLKKISSRISRLNQEMMIAIAKRAERFLQNLPDDGSQTKVRKKMNETIAEIKNIAKTAIPHQFVSSQESAAKCQGDNHNLSSSESDNDISECTQVTVDIYPEPHSRNDFYKGVTNFITEHILAPKIRATQSLQSAMELFNQLNESDDFNSARFTVLLIDKINSMKKEFVPEVMGRVLFFLDRFKTDCELSVSCFSQYILRYNILFFLNDFTEYLSEKKIKDLSVEFEALKTSIRIAYPDLSVYPSLCDDLFVEGESSTIFNGLILAQSLNSLQALLRETMLHDTDEVMLMMRNIRSINKWENSEERFRLDKRQKNNEIAQLMHNILTGSPGNYNIELRIEKNKQQYTNGILIWLALESGKFDDATLNGIVDAKLEKTLGGYHFLKGLLASNPAMTEDHITRFLKIINPGADASTAYTMGESYAIAILYKVFAINKTSIISRLVMTDAPTFSYLEAMLNWRHPGRLSDDATMDDISIALVTSGREAIPEASCRLLDFILEQAIRGKAVSDITVYQCCRFIHARTFNATDEQTLYQGITLYLGKGCVSDKEEGLQRINQALASDSPIPALRMARLQGQQLFPANVLEQDCLKLFAHKADTDQELYRNYKQVIFTEILLSLGESGLDWLIGQLKRAPDNDISSSRIAELLQNKLDIWRKNGIESTRQSPPPDVKGVATVISKQPSQSAVKPKSHLIWGKRTQRGKQQEGNRCRNLFQIRPRPGVRQEQSVPIQQLLEQLIVKNKDKVVSEIPDEEITELLKLLEQLKRKTATAIRDLPKNRLANLVQILPWSATILGEVIAAHLKNMTDPHARANYARQRLERYECLISVQRTVKGYTETHPQGAMGKAQPATGKLLMQQPAVPPGVQELIKNTTQVHQEALLSGNLSKDELSASVRHYPDLYLHYLQETNKPEINCVKKIWEGLGTTSQTALLIKTGAILITDQCETDRNSAVRILNHEKLNDDARLSLFESLQDESKEALLMLSERIRIPDNLVRAYLERMKKTQPKQDTTRHQIRSIKQWMTSLEKRLTDNLIHLLKELPSGAEEPDKMKLREFRETLKKDMDSKIESARESVTSLTKRLAKCFKASAILMELREIAKAEAEQETL